LHELYQNLMRDRYSKVIAKEKNLTSQAFQAKVKKLVRDKEIKFN